MEHERTDAYADTTVHDMYEKRQHQAQDDAQRADLCDRGTHIALLRRGLSFVPSVLGDHGGGREAIRIQIRDYINEVK